MARTTSPQCAAVLEYGDFLANNPQGASICLGQAYEQEQLATLP